jgi:TRAP-type C4-dicarboxylate transport system permease small subunit
MEEVIDNQPEAEKLSPFMKVISQISRVMAAVGAVTFAAMMLITVIDVTGRNLFLIPLNGAVEIVGLLLVLGGTWGMGYCHLLKMHIRINILTERFPPRWKALFWIVTCFVSLVVSGMIAWRAYDKVNHYFSVTLGTTTDVLGWPLWPFVLAMAIGFSWLVFVLVIDIIVTVAKVVRR